MVMKVKDLAVKTGTYKTSMGEVKHRYKTVGSLMKSDDGSTFIFLDRAFNPAGVPFKEGSSEIIISLYDPKGTGDAYEGGAKGAASSPIDDNIPF